MLTLLDRHVLTRPWGTTTLRKYTPFFTLLGELLQRTIIKTVFNEKPKNTGS